VFLPSAGWHDESAGDVMTATAVASSRRRSPPRIRQAQAADLTSVIALDQRVTGLAKPEYWREMFDQYGQQRPSNRFFLVAESQDVTRVLGFIVGEVRAWEFGSAPCGWVLALSVEPESRLHGIGETLFQSISREFKAAGVSKMRTMVARDNRLHLLFFRGEGMIAGPYIQLEKDLD
jgi:ribosomal protein S18 acetylase RimI-like enzyme